ncbi:hypothetical protein Ana3638_18760 [Anaerocolumna sedimenticola]|uniref:Uncharacterized protein n=1 Tax=Anaerocolumna sedimenticola TaxID=2696063 RepID=A0A6P1TRL9_9FIRM|nr:hypothetical protein [Anaerocolumna sedimenticola]QHQ62571.1 hypothetical protein Ana3638_18760 [Anaerocolumna sedimenticola]
MGKQALTDNDLKAVAGGSDSGLKKCSWCREKPHIWYNDGEARLYCRAKGSYFTVQQIPCDTWSDIWNAEG